MAETGVEPSLTARLDNLAVLATDTALYSPFSAAFVAGGIIGAAATLEFAVPVEDRTLFPADQQYMRLEGKIKQINGEKDAAQTVLNSGPDLSAANALNRTIAGYDKQISSLRAQQPPHHPNIKAATETGSVLLAAVLAGAAIHMAVKHRVNKAKQRLHS